MSGFAPDWAVPPGNTIREIMRQRNLSEPQLTELLNKSNSYIAGLLSGEIPITHDDATLLSVILGSTPGFWQRRQERFEHFKESRVKHSFMKWVEEIPFPDMVRYGWISNVKDRAHAALEYFGYSDIDHWYRNDQSKALLAFRKSDILRENPIAVQAWVRRGEILADSISCKPWNRQSFIDLIYNSRYLTRKKNPEAFLAELVAQCSECGVAITVARAPKGCPVSGAAKFIRPDKGLIILSFRYLTDDQFWFTFYHEAAHLILHDQSSIFVDTSMNDEMYHTDRLEIEANEFASEVLIPKSFRTRVLNVPLTPKALMRLALEIGISVGILVGQLQHLRRIEFSRLNYLKRRFIWEG